jgi:inhibitor of KinA
MPQFEPLGDQGVMARFADEEQALRWAARVRRPGADRVVDVVQAYTTVAVFHDREQLPLAEALRRLADLGREADAEDLPPGPLHVIPCCYDLGPDLGRVARQTGLAREEVIRLHASAVYTVYAIGFSPGFPYLGYLPTPLCGVPRLESPRLRVEPGSVGLTGRQTGIYPEARPGGWNLIGRTPMLLVDVAEGYFPLRTGDRVRFEPVGEAEYARLLGRRL